MGYIPLTTHLANFKRRVRNLGSYHIQGPKFRATQWNIPLNMALYGTLPPFSGLDMSSDNLLDGFETS